MLYEINDYLTYYVPGIGMSSLQTPGSVALFIMVPENFYFSLLVWKGKDSR